MEGTLALFVALEIPVLFFQVASTLLLRRRRPDHALQKLWVLQFPLLFLGAVGLPLFALWKVLSLRG